MGKEGTSLNVKLEMEIQFQDSVRGVRAAAAPLLLKDKEKKGAWRKETLTADVMFA